MSICNSMRYDLTPSCMKATRDVTAKFCRHRRILWVSEPLCSQSRLLLGILHFYYAFLIYKYSMYNIPEMTWVPITSTLSLPIIFIRVWLSGLASSDSFNSTEPEFAKPSNKFCDDGLRSVTGSAGLEEGSK